MANQITDNRTLINAADATTNWTNLSGTGAGTLDTEIFIEGTGSVGLDISNTLDGLLYNIGSTPFAANEVIYIWINCGIVGLLDTKANGGMRIRFAGSTITNWFEVYVGGSDEWPPSVLGGWTMFVVDVTTARADAVANGQTNGTTPAVTAVQRVGWAGVTGGTMPRMVDNTWVDAIWRLPAGTPGIIVEGRSGGTTPWTWAEVLTEIGPAAGIIKLGAGGSYVLNTPIQFGINDATTHGFEDTNIILLWEDQEFIPDNFYEISSFAGASGANTLTAGIKTGTGSDATGSQGWIISAAATGARWGMDVNDGNMDAVEWFGCSFIHGGTLTVSSTVNELVSTQYIDCFRIFAVLAIQTRISLIDAAAGNSEAVLGIQDLTDVTHSTFFGGTGLGHALEILANPSRVEDQTSLDNTFNNYAVGDGFGNSAVFNDTAGLVNIAASGGTTFSIRNGTSASTVVTSNVDVTFLGHVISPNSRLRITATDTVGAVTDGDILANELMTTDPHVYQHNYEGDLTFDWVIRNFSGTPRYRTTEGSGTISSTGIEINVNQILY